MQPSMLGQKFCVDLPEIVVLSIAFLFSLLYITGEIRSQFVLAYHKNACCTKIYMKEKVQLQCSGCVHITTGSSAR